LPYAADGSGSLTAINGSTSPHSMHHLGRSDGVRLPLSASSAVIICGCQRRTHTTLSKLIKVYGAIGNLTAQAETCLAWHANQR
jgi:hypothetical protein